VRRLTSALEIAERQDHHPPLGWLDAPPPGTHWVRLATALPAGVTVQDAGLALCSWELHRAAGLRIAADGPAQLGGTVVCGWGLGPFLTLAPCRVVEAIDEPDRIGFAYATLPRHPELGVERFTMTRQNTRVQFTIEAVSRHHAWTARFAPLVSNFVQDQLTSSYLKAARRIGATPGPSD
jgi:uncharacterized protein (UPF0548 family)